MSMTAEHHHHHDAPAKGGVIDPVCGMTVDPNAGKPHADYQGTDLSFLLQRLPHQFLADPQKYLAATGDAAATHRPAAAGSADRPGARSAA